MLALLVTGLLATASPDALPAVVVPDEKRAPEVVGPAPRDSRVFAAELLAFGGLAALSGGGLAAASAVPALVVDDGARRTALWVGLSVVGASALLLVSGAAFLAFDPATGTTRFAEDPS